MHTHTPMSYREISEAVDQTVDEFSNENDSVADLQNGCCVHDIRCCSSWCT